MTDVQNFHLPQIMHAIAGKELHGLDLINTKEWWLPLHKILNVKHT